MSDILFHSNHDKRTSCVVFYGDSLTAPLQPTILHGILIQDTRVSHNVSHSVFTSLSNKNLIQLSGETPRTLSVSALILDNDKNQYNTFVDEVWPKIEGSNRSNTMVSIMIDKRIYSGVLVALDRAEGKDFESIKTIQMSMIIIKERPISFKKVYDEKPNLALNQTSFPKKIPTPTVGFA